jgi:N-hydroxyarylamine O-acetyltransferase
MNPETPNFLDLDAYLARTEYRGPLSPTAEALAGLHLAHATHIPFENLDILLGRPVRLDLASLQAKLVTGKRGGYCFEQNTLFAAVLQRVGFGVTTLAARVRFGATRILPRTHMLLKVDGAGGPWLADVGFGGGGPLCPIPLVPGQPSPQYSWTFRVTQDQGLWVLQSLRAGVWSDLYAFTLEPHYPIDFEMANHYTSTYPSSRFVQTLTAQRSTPEARFILRHRELTVDRGGALTSRAVEEADLLALLSETFGLDFPPGTSFPSRPPLP